MSKARKEVMIKSVLQSIPSYITSSFVIPDEILNNIEKMLNYFWWGGGNNNKGIRRLSWEKLPCTNKEGGIGFKDFKAFNMAMVAKQGWHMMTKHTRWWPESSNQVTILDPLFLKLTLVITRVFSREVYGELGLY